MTSIRKQFEEKEKVFIPFTVAGYPDRKESKKIIETLIQNGADIIELGVPFSDPMADGPTIQQADMKALQNNIDVNDVLEIASEYTETPIVLLAYANTIKKYGYKEFFKKAEKAGVNGLIIPDMPPEEYEKEIAGINTEIKQIFLIAQNTPPERIRQIANKTEGFAYLVSVKRTTGARKGFSEKIKNLTKKTEQLEIPKCVGFGISSKKEAKTVANSKADGLIMGSALIDKYNKAGKKELGKHAKNISQTLKQKN